MSMQHRWNDTGENRHSWRRTCPSANLSITNSTRTGLRLYPGLRRETTTTTSSLSHGRVPGVNVWPLTTSFNSPPKWKSQAKKTRLNAGWTSASDRTEFGCSRTLWTIGAVECHAAVWYLQWVYLENRCLAPILICVSWLRTQRKRGWGGGGVKLTMAMTSQVRKMEMIGLNQPLIYIHPFRLLSPQFLLFALFQLSSQGKS
jgi:hypothetical protein